MTRRQAGCLAVVVFVIALPAFAGSPITITPVYSGEVLNITFSASSDCSRALNGIGISLDGQGWGEAEQQEPSTCKTTTSCDFTYTLNTYCWAPGVTHTVKATKANWPDCGQGYQEYSATFVVPHHHPSTIGPITYNDTTQTIEFDCHVDPGAWGRSLTVWYDVEDEAHRLCCADGYTVANDGHASVFDAGACDARRTAIVLLTTCNAGETDERSAHARQPYVVLRDCPVPNDTSCAGCCCSTGSGGGSSGGGAGGGNGFGGPSGPSSPAGPSSSLGHPIEITSGNVRASVPLFSIAQDPMPPLTFGLTYDSIAPYYPGSINWALGSGWTHNFNTRLAPVTSSRLMLLGSSGQRFYFDQVSTGRWLAIKPLALPDVVTLAGGEYVLTQQNGFEWHYDAATGRWNSCRDRWGNTVTASYSGGLLTAVTDMEGRQLTFTYTSGALTSVVLPDSSAWTFAYNGGELSSIVDPLGHTWKTFEYANDSHGVPRLLTAVRDAGGALLEGHAYDAQDRGVTSFVDGSRESITVQYDTPATGQVQATEIVDGTSRVATFTLNRHAGRASSPR